ncbi:MAG: class I SAM-dependent methyltransferase [Myxococcaceae bacterium]
MRELPQASQLGELPLGELWRLRERVQFIRENVETVHLQEDFTHVQDGEALWTAFEALEPCIDRALVNVAGALAMAMRSGELTPMAFRALWARLGWTAHPESGGTAADDFLEGAFHVARLTLGERRPELGMPNMSSRARQLDDFLSSTRPGANDVVYDLGSGNGKAALTFAASTSARVFGVELGESYVTAARSTAALFGLCNVNFVQADVRAVDLSGGSIFYLYYPFHGHVARDVATALGKLACVKPVTIFAAGPKNEFGEHFLAQVEGGALRLAGRYGDSGEALLLKSA